MQYKKDEVRAQLRTLVREEMEEAAEAKGCHSPHYADAARTRAFALGKLLDRLLYETPKSTLLRLAAANKIKDLDDAMYEAMDEDDYP